METPVDIKAKAAALGQRRARLEDSITNWSERVDDIHKMISILRDAWQRTKDEEQELHEQLKQAAAGR